MDSHSLLYDIERLAFVLEGQPKGSPIKRCPTEWQNEFDAFVCKCISAKALTPQLVDAYWRQSKLATGWRSDDAYSRRRKVHPAIGCAWSSPEFPPMWRHAVNAMHEIFQMIRTENEKHHAA